MSGDHIGMGCMLRLWGGGGGDYISPGGDRTAHVIRGIAIRTPREGIEEWGGVGSKMEMGDVNSTSSCDKKMHVVRK